MKFSISFWEWTHQKKVGCRSYSVLLCRKQNQFLELLIRQAKLPPKPKPGIDMAVFKEIKELLHRLRKCVSAIMHIQDTELLELRAQLAGTTGIFAASRIFVALSEYSL